MLQLLTDVKKDERWAEKHKNDNQLLISKEDSLRNQKEILCVWLLARRASENRKCHRIQHHIGNVQCESASITA